jgi:ATP-binding cassette subfamily B protein
MSSKGRSGMSRLLEISGSKKIHLIFSAVLALASSICALAPYIVIYRVLRLMLSPDFGPSAYPRIWSLALAGVGFVVARYLIFFAANMLSHVAAFTILYNLRARLAAHLGRLPMGYFNANQTGKIKKVMYEDVEELEHFIAHHIPDIVSGAILPALIVGYLFTVDWRMALVALIPLPLAFVFQRKAFDNGGKEDRRKQYHDSLEDMNGTIVEYVRGMPVVKIFNQTVSSFTRLKEAAISYRDFIKEITLAMAPAWAAFIVITSSGLIFILPFGLWFYLAGIITLPVLFLFLLLGSGYMQPLLKLAMLGGQLGHILEGLGRMDAVLDVSPLPDPENPIVPTANDISFNHVAFGYTDAPVLKDVSFSVSEGSVTALVGPSGAGKSTIAQLLLRMWDVWEGEIRIGGIDIRKLSQRELMNRIGFVFQDGFIFSDTVYENIRMGMENVSREDIEAAARAARCEEFIRRLPRGLDTRIGEGGEVHLSGGEKQRIALARVVLKDAPIVILDEATAYADAENEAKIQAAFSEIMRNKTVIVIAHRLSTITDADEILVIRDGRVAEQGRHEALTRTETFYKTMWRAHTAAREWRLGPEGGATC